MRSDNTKALISCQCDLVIDTLSCDDVVSNEVWAVVNNLLFNPIADASISFSTPVFTEIEGCLVSIE
jgi:hypothetical protein